ncbi:MAG: transcriptional regulator [Deltaproteobacteria bacterium HGW-Deltaproteobacteria-15]|jgi:transcriptional regulator with XRE-family HTH domain|nr:MAG: transcriptional regulator [Deltaproteobacteria bacterium HGW-Deltaproteobacteria-15]
MEQLGLKLRSLRKQKQLSLKQLAERVGCSPSYLSMVENSKIDPGVSRLKRIADGLGITIVDLFQTPAGRSLVIRSHERICAEFPSSRTRIEILVPQVSEKQIDARMAIIHPGGSSSGEYRHPGEEFGYVISGMLELTVDGVDYALREGDSFYFASTSNHYFRNPGKEDTFVLWVNHPPSW